MKLSTKVRYGLRAMIELALDASEEPMLIETIATKQDVSKKYLENLLVSLRSAGLVRSIRGSKGGYVLAQEPVDITAKDIVEALDGPLEIVECHDHKQRCDRSTTCVAAELWHEVNEAMVTVLRGTTLHDLCERAKLKNEERTLMYYI